jgi:hypothetical protein
MAAQTYTVASGATIHWSGGVMFGGKPVPPEYLAELGPDGLQAALKAGSLVADQPATPARSKASE